MESVGLVQGIYFFLTGIWPILHIKSFMAVTGPKTDLWLLRTVGVLVTAIGIDLIVSEDPSMVLGIGSALGLAIIDIIYVAKKVISKIYLADAAAELVLCLWWLLAYG
jgi:hypothetical protein